MTPYLFGILKMDRPAWIKYLLAKGIPWTTYEISELISGTTLSLIDSIKRPLIDFHILGNTIQEGIPSPTNPVPINSVGDNVNLFDKDTMGTRVNRYIITTSDKWSQSSDSYSVAIPCEPNKTYTISHNVTTATIFRCAYIKVSSYSGTNDIPVFARYIGTTDLSHTIQTGDDATFLIFQANAALMPDIINSLKVEESDKATPYSPYNMGSIGIEKCNKNLMSSEYEQGTLNASGETSSSTTRIRTKDFVSIDSSKSYILSASFEGTKQAIIYEYDKTKTFLQQITSAWQNISYNFITSANTRFIKIVIRNSDNSTIVTSDVSNIQLEQGSTATSYIPHQSTTYPIYTQSPFRAIGEVRDDFVKQVGKWYERHKIGHILSYNGETITTPYMSTTGELSTGAEIIYVLAEPTLTPCTAEQVEQLEAITNSDTYNGGTNIYSQDNVPPYLETKYWKVR